MVGWLFALLSYHSWVLFSSLTVTYVLYLNIPGQKVIIPRAHLLTTRKRAEVLPDGSRALSEGDAPAGPRPAGSTEAGSRQGTGFGATSFSALWWPRGA